MGQLGSAPGLQGWAIFTTPIKIPLPPLGQTSGSLTHGSAPPAQQPMSKKASLGLKPHGGPLLLGTGGYQCPQTNESLKEAPAVSTQLPGREIMGFMGLGLGPAWLQTLEGFILPIWVPLTPPQLPPPSLLHSHPPGHGGFLSNKLEKSRSFRSRAFALAVPCLRCLSPRSSTAAPGHQAGLSSNTTASPVNL